MELVLMRTYYPEGTNGILLYDELALCHTIELPCKANNRSISCVPEGKYELKKCYSPKFKWHLLVENVPKRDLILIHPANDAIKELKGCIAPVTTITGEGKGDKSRVVFEKLKAFVFPVLERGEKVFLVVRQEEVDRRPTTDDRKEGKEVERSRPTTDDRLPKEGREVERLKGNEAGSNADCFVPRKDGR